MAMNDARQKPTTTTNSGVCTTKSDLEVDLELKRSPTNVDGQSDEIKVDKHGILLFPQPTKDPLDPLNWSRGQKSVIIFILCLSSLLGIYLQTVVASSVFLLMAEFNTTYSEINWTLAAPALTAALAPLLLSSLGGIYGRRSVMICCSATTLLMTGLTTIHGLSYGAYMFLRLAQGFGSGLATVVSFALLQDVTFQHERGIYIGLWVLSADMGFILGAIFGGFSATAGVNVPQYHVTGAYAVLLLLEIIFLPETLYPRATIEEKIRNNENYQDFPRTKLLKVWKPGKIPGILYPRHLDSAYRFCKIWRFPKVPLTIVPFFFFQYWWNMSVITMEPAAYADKSTTTQALLYIGFAVGILMGEFVCSGNLNDIICARLAKRNNNIRTPEMRLCTVYVGVVLSSAGSILWGISVDRQCHWMVGQVAFFLLAFGLQVANASIATYAFESYSDYPLEILTFYSVIANVSVFLMPFFINSWVLSVGYTWCFITQALLNLMLVPLYGTMQKWGSHLDKEMSFE